MLASPLALRASLALVAIAAFTAACSSDPNNPTGSGGSAGSSTGGSSSSSSGTGAGGSDPECPPGPGYAGAKVDVPITSAEATVVDLAGAPITQSTVQLCGLDICLNGVTDGTGHVIFNESITLDTPVFKFGDGYATAKLGLPVTMAATVFPTLVTGRFPATGAVLAAGKDITSGDVTLKIAAGTTLVIDELIYDTPEKQQFRAVTIPVDKATAFLDPTLNLELFYGASPLETVMCPAVGVTVPNTGGWPAGTAVEFYAHGVDVFQEWVKYGGWQKVSEGQVSADGATISTAAGGGLPVITAFGIRKKP